MTLPGIDIGGSGMNAALRGTGGGSYAGDSIHVSTPELAAKAAMPHKECIKK